MRLIFGMPNPLFIRRYREELPSDSAVSALIYSNQILTVVDQ